MVNSCEIKSIFHRSPIYFPQKKNSCPRHSIHLRFFSCRIAQRVSWCDICTMPAAEVRILLFFSNDTPSLVRKKPRRYMENKDLKEIWKTKISKIPAVFRKKLEDIWKTNISNHDCLVVWVAWNRRLHLSESA